MSSEESPAGFLRNLSVIPGEKADHLRQMAGQLSRSDDASAVRSKYYKVQGRYGRYVGR